MGYNYQDIDIDDFSGGETDNYVKSAVNRSQFLENFYLLDTRKPVTRPGCRVDDSENTPQLLIGSQRVSKLISFDDGLFNLSLNQLSFRNPTDYELLQGPTGNNAFSSVVSTSDYAHAKWSRILILTSNQLEKPVKVYKDDAGDFQLRTAGLPPLASAPICTPTAGDNNYIYGFAHQYTYNVGDQEFIDVGPVTLVEVSNASAPDSNQIAITVIPVLANGADGNYDTPNIKKVVYRSANGGGVLYKVTELANATTSYNDTMSDTTLQTNDAIYTTGDVPDNDPPPLAKYCHTAGGFTFYGHIQVGSDVLPNVLRQSQADDPDSVPEAFEVALEDEITGISSVQGKPIVGCQDYIYALDGGFDELGRGGLTQRRISDTAGCVSNNSFVQTEVGLFWAGNDGFYCTVDGISVFKVSSHLNQRYKERLNTLRDRAYIIQGKYDAINERILWSFSQTAFGVGAEECDIIWVCDLRYGVNREMCFYTWLGDETFLPSALEIHDKELYRGDRFGYVLKFSTDYLFDDVVDPDIDAADWLQGTIRWRYRSSAQNFGTSGTRKIANKILISAKNETNVSIAITALNDDSKITREIEPIRWRKNFTWGDEEFVWGDPQFTWYFGGLIEQDRRFPARSLRFNYLQIELKNDFSNIVNSTALGNCDFDLATLTCTLVDAEASWPSGAVDYYIYFPVDNYTIGYRIISRDSDTVVTIEDLDGTLLADALDTTWQIKGYKKGEILSLNEYSIRWALASRSHDVFNKTDRGALE